jgi:Uma2 family endonuclease
MSRREYELLARAGAFEGERVELIRGQVLRMSPMGVPHAQSVQKLNMLFVRRFGHVADVRPQCPLAISDDTLPEPDLVLVDPQAVDVSEDAAGALLVVEISDSSLRFDRGLKSQLYAEAQVPEYWVVNLPEGLLEVFREPRDGRYRQVQTLERDAQVECQRLPGVRVPVAELLVAAR